MEAIFGSEEDIDIWMDLVAEVRYEFPGLETEEALADHRKTVLKFMSKKQAICFKDKDKITGVILISRGKNMICFLATDPGYRRTGVASALMDKALSELDHTRDITVTTFREEDPKGTAPRALYRKYGFTEGELVEEFGYPNQVFTLRPIER